jgi:twinkle protein
MARIPDDTKPFIVGDSIGDILAEARIELGRKRLSPGRSVKTVCPACGGGSTREDSLSVKLDDDGQGVTWHCKRGTCGGNRLIPGGGRIDGGQRRPFGGNGDEEPRRRERPPVVKPTLHRQSEQQRPESLYALFEKRGISRETVDEFGIYGIARRWPQTEERDGKQAVVKDGEGEVVFVSKPTLVFPYVWRGEVVNRKFRSVDKQFAQDRDSLRTLFNADAVTSPDEVILCEGEFDVMALWEAGFRQVVSLPDGTPQKLLDEDDPKRQDDQRFDPLENCAEILAPAKRIVIATDADVPGGYLAEEFARRLGRARCWRVRYPEGCKDSNDVLQKHGADALRECIQRAEPWPLAGLWSPKPGSLREWLMSGREPRGLDCGIRALDEVARLPHGGGWLTVVTGIPSHGKSSFLRCWLPYVAQKHDVGIVWWSPEDNRPEVLAVKVAEVLKGQPAREAGTLMPEWMMAEAEDWIRERITFLYADNPDVEHTLDWAMARAIEAKRRHKRQLFVVDPWNEVEHQLGRNESETQYVGRSLRKLKAWGRSEAMDVLICAHPVKLIADPKTKKYPKATLYDVNGGANWANRADLGITIYRERNGEMQVICQKARFPAFGKREAMATLKVDPRTGRLGSIAQQDTLPEENGDG